jgi:hypothetical protein
MMSPEEYIQSRFRESSPYEKENPWHLPEVKERPLQIDGTAGKDDSFNTLKSRYVEPVVVPSDTGKGSSGGTAEFIAVVNGAPYNYRFVATNLGPA